MVEVHGLAEIIDEVLDAYVGHRQYYWVRPRTTWLESPCPVFLDFGDDWVAQLDSYDDYKLPWGSSPPRSSSGALCRL